MAGIDYAQVRARINIGQVLALIQFHQVESLGEQVRGPCPIHGSSSAASRSFSVNLRKNTFQCFKCGASGNQLDLWVAVSQVTLFDAASDLCQRLGIAVPTIRKV